MAKQRFDVNTQIKLLETTKQFVGGLKTVDTDDSLGSFFLRDAENISLSEYGFIEKRYGLIDTGDIDTSAVSNVLLNTNGNNKVQGYFEYVRDDGFIDQILFVNGRLFLSRADDGVQTVPDVVDGRFHQVRAFTRRPDSFSIEIPALNNYIQTFILDPIRFSGQTQGQTFNNFDDLFLGIEEIEATRIEEKLYIFTGVYPLVYEGDGNFYLMEEFVPNFTELQLFSHNIHNADNAKYYSDVSEQETISNGKFLPTSDTNIVFEFVDEVAYPRLPFTKKEGTIFNIEVAYSLHRSLLPQQPFVGFLSGTVKLTEATGGTFAEIVPKVYYRPSGIGVTSLDWVQIPQESLVYTHRTNFDEAQYTVDTFKTYSDSDKPNFIEFPGGINYFKFNYEPDSTRAKNEPIGSENPYKIEIQNMPIGNFDIRVDLVLQKTGYQELGTGDLRFVRGETDDSKIITRIYRDITFTEEQLTDYLQIDPAGLWTCNRVLNHYGKLMAYGSRINPQTVYVGHPTYKEYFPDFFTIDFETDDKQEVQKITPFMNILVVQSESFTWGLKGIDALVESNSPYQQFTINSIYGTIAPKSVRAVRNQLFFLSREGIVSLNSLYATDDQYNIKHLDKNIENIVPLDRDATAIQFDNQYWIHFPNTKNNMTLRYYIDTKSWVKDTYFEWNGLDAEGEPRPSNLTFNGIHKYIRKDGDLYLVTHLMQTIPGQNLVVAKIMVDESMPTDLGQAPKTMFETAYMNQGHPFHPKKYLENRYDFTIQNEYNFARNGEVARLENADFTANNGAITATLTDLDTLKPNHSYRVDVINLDRAPLITVNERGEQVANFVNENIGLGITLFKDGEVIATEFAVLRVTAEPVLYEDFSIENQIQFRLINNDDENVDLYYGFDLPANQENNLNLYPNKIENVGTRNITEKIILEIPNAFQGSIHNLYVIAKAKNKAASAFVTRQYTLSGTSFPPEIQEIDFLDDVTETTVTLNWIDRNTGGSDNFRGYYRNLSTAQTSESELLGNVSTYTFTDLTPGNVYRFYIGAFANASWSPDASIDATVKSGLLPPSNITVTGTRTAKVSWQNQNVNETGKLLQFTEDILTLTENSPTPIQLAANTTFRDVILGKDNTLYKFRMKAFFTPDNDPTVFSAWSNEVQYVHLVPPRSMVFVNVGQLFLQGEYENYPTAEGYEIGIKLTSDPDEAEFWTDVQKDLQQATDDNFRITFSGLDQDTAYDIRYRVIFVRNNEEVFTPYSTVTQDTIPPFQLTAAPTVTVQAQTYNSITLRIRNNEAGEVLVYSEQGNKVPELLRGAIANVNGTFDVTYSNLPNALTQYEFSSAAKRSDNTKILSNYILTTASTTDFPIIGPARNFATSSITGNYPNTVFYTVTWLEPNVGAEFFTGFDLEIITQDSDRVGQEQISVLALGPDTRSYNGSVRSGSNYVRRNFLRIRAKNSFGRVSAYSNTITISGG
jgi:hypothetical protein